MLQTSDELNTKRALASDSQQQQPHRDKSMVIATNCNSLVTTQKLCDLHVSRMLTKDCQSNDQRVG